MNDLCYAIESALGMIVILAAAFIVGVLIVEAVRSILRKLRERWMV